MWSISKEISQAIHSLHIEAERLYACNSLESKKVQAKAMDIFVKDNPRVWWLSLKKPYQVFDYPNGDGYMFLDIYIPKEDNKFWFIPETEDDNLPVYQTDVRTVQAIIAECSPFEYYIVGKNFNWMLIENDHNSIIYVPKESTVE